DGRRHLLGLELPVDGLGRTREAAHAARVWSRLHFWSTPSFWPGILYQFDGLFTCEETAEGTRVRHREAVSLRPPLAWVVEPLLRDWLARDTAEEMARMKALLEQ